MEQYKDDPDRPKVTPVPRKESNPLESKVSELEEKIRHQDNEIQRLYREIGRMKNHINLISKAFNNAR